VDAIHYRIADDRIDRVGLRADCDLSRVSDWGRAVTLYSNREDSIMTEWEEMIEAGVCPLCGGDCGSANPPVYECPMKKRAVDTGDELHQVLGDALRKFGTAPNDQAWVDQ
jgi:hypothetical protein